jgi:hypothetical protein
VRVRDALAEAAGLELLGKRLQIRRGQTELERREAQ